MVTVSDSLGLLHNVKRLIGVTLGKSLDTLEPVLPTIALDPLSDHFGKFFDCDSRDIAQTGDDLLVLKQEDL